MSALLALQRDFQACVLGESDAVSTLVVGSHAGSAKQRVDIYANAVRLRFEEVLGQEYPGLVAMLGHDSFARLALGYAAAFPSRHPSIRWFGRNLAEYLEATPPWCEQKVITEMAQFEWSKGELLDAPDSTPVGLEEVASVPAEHWAQLQPRGVPAHRRLRLHCNVPAIWQAIEADAEPPPIKTSDTPVHWLLWRQGLHIHWRSLHDDEVWALEACAQGANFGDLCAGLCRWHDEDGAPFRAATLLKQWVSDQLLRAI